MKFKEREKLTLDRLAALKAMSDTDLLVKAAEIIKTEPAVGVCAYRSVIRNSVTDISAYLDDADKPCHCLLGAVQEAAGAYVADPALSAGFFALPEVQDVFDEKHRATICRRIVAVLDVSALGERFVQAAKSEKRYAAIVFAYSDTVLHSLGRQGPAAAARILLAAASVNLADLPLTEEDR